MESLRIDKWLWAARFFKTRSIAQDAIGKSHIQVNHQRCKASREVRIGDTVTIKKGAYTYEVVIQGLNDKRTSASIAVELYEETAESQEKRKAVAQMQRASRLSQPVSNEKPNKKIRRQLAKLKHYPPN